MRRAVLTALLSVALVTAAGSFGAMVVGDAAHDVRDAPDPFVESDGVVDAGSDGENDSDGGFYGVSDAPLFRLSSPGESGDEGSTTPRNDGAPAESSPSDGGAPERRWGRHRGPRHRR